MSKEAETFQSFILETDSVASMEPMIGEDEIPTGWSLGTAVKKDGSKTLYYYCQGTGQHFFTYSDMLRYVEYAKRAQLGIYEPCRKSIKRQRKVEEDKIRASKRTVSGLSIPKKPSVFIDLTKVEEENSVIDLVEEENRATESEKALSVLSVPKKPSEPNSLPVLDQTVEYVSTTSSESTNEEDEDYELESDCDDLAESDTVDEEKQIVREEMDDHKAP